MVEKYYACEAIKSTKYIRGVLDKKKLNEKDVEVILKTLEYIKECLKNI